MTTHGAITDPHLYLGCGGDLDGASTEGYACACLVPHPRATTRYCGLEQVWVVNTAVGCLRCRMPWDANPADYERNGQGRAQRRGAQVVALDSRAVVVDERQLPLFAEAG